MNECADNINRCQQKCVNTNGSYKCECNDGYKLRDDRKTCSELTRKLYFKFFNELYFVFTLLCNVASIELGKLSKSTLSCATSICKGPA